MIIKELIKEINQGKNLERNLPAYLNEMMTLDYTVANFSATFHYYTFTEMLLEKDYSDVEGFMDTLNQVNECIKVAFDADAKVEDLNDAAKKLDDVRKNVIKKMKVLTSYTDVLQVYEYILNRIEAKYTKASSNVSNQELTARIMQYIFNDKDNAAANAKIQEIVGQLPVRMTKSRFLDLIKDSLSIYNGSDKASVETFLYMVRTGATLDRPEGYDTEYKVFADYKKKFEAVDYKNLSDEKYHEIYNDLEKAGDLLEHTAEAFYSLQELINDIYVILITKPYAYMPGTIDVFRNDMKICAETISALNNVNYGKDTRINKSVTDNLVLLEGKQEKALDLRNTAESIFYDVEENQKELLTSMMLMPAMSCLGSALKLQSNSIFIELDRVVDESVADDIFMKRTEKKLIKELDELLTACTQVSARAIMGNVLSKLPVFFNNKNEIGEYVMTSLESCKDEAEKTACVQLIQDIIG